MELAHTQDHILLHRWHNRRDAEAFRALVERHAGLVYAAAHRVLRDPTDAEDVSQECFITLARSKSLPERHLGAWLYTVAVNRAKDHIRGAARRRKREELHGAALPGAVEANWDDTLAHVDEAIASLDDELRQVIIAHFLEAKSQGEIADTTGVSRQTVNARVKRGVEAIREHLAKKGITATTASLTALLGTQMVEAAPAALVAALGKVALSGGVMAAGGGMLAKMAGLLTTKVAAGLVALLVSLFAFDVFHRADESLAQGDNPVAKPVAGEATVQLAQSVPEQSTGVSEVQASLTSSDLGNDGGLGGIVLDANGQPTQDTVYVSAMADRDWNSRSDWNTPESQRYLETHVYREVEAVKGVFEIPAFPQHTVGTIQARDDVGDRISESVRFDTASESARSITLRLQHYGSISGTLVDNLGSPIPRATVDSGGGSAVVDDNGNFHIDKVPPGRYTLTAGENNHDDIWVSYGTVSEEVTVGDGEQVTGVLLTCVCAPSRIAGRVVDESGHGVPDLPLQLTSVPGQTQKAEIHWLRVKTDSRGQFSFEHYGPGHYWISGRNDAWKINDAPNVRSGETDLVLTAASTLENRIRIRVIDGATGQPVTRFSYSVINGEGGGTGDEREYPDGRLTIYIGPKPGASLNVKSAGIGSANYNILPGDLDGAEVFIKLKSLPPVEGIVLDFAGNPVAGARIQIHAPTPVDHIREPLTRTDGSGRFMLTDLEPDVTEVYVIPDTQPFVHVPLEHREDWTIRLPEGGEIQGKVVASGRPLFPVNVMLTRNMYRSDVDLISRQSATSEDGTYRFSGLPHGNYTIDVTLPSDEGISYQGDARGYVDVVPKKCSKLDFAFETMSAGATLSGQFYVDGVPAGGSVNLRATESNRFVSDHNGHSDGTQGYRIENLVPCPVEISASLGKRTKRTLYKLEPGANTLDFQFVPGGATLDCVLDLDRTDVFRVSYEITVDTSLGPERITVGMQPLTPSGLRILDLPGGNGKIAFRVHFNNGKPDRVFTGTLGLVVGNLTSITFPPPENSAALTVAVEGEGEGMASIVYLLPGEVDLSGISDMTPLEYRSWEVLSTAVSDQVNSEGTCQFDYLEPGTYTVFSLTFPASAEPSPDTFPEGTRTASTVVTLEPETEAQVTLAFP